MNKPKQPRTILAITVVLIIGAALGWGIVQRDPAATADEDHAEHGEGDHGHGAQAPGQADEHASDKPASDKPASDKPAEAARGPKGGRLLRDGGYALEVTIFEDGVPPEFRLYTYRDDKPLPPAQSTVRITLERLGRTPQTIAFTPMGDYLRGDAEVVEPHSFKVNIEATEGGRTHRFGYEQEEARVNMSDAQLKQAGITLAVAGPARIGSALELLGEVRYNADRTVQVVPRLDGLVEQVTASAGQAVRKGQVLAVLSSPALADQRADALAARKRVALARATFEREKQLWEDKITAKQDYLQAQAALQEAEIVEQSLRQKLAHLGTSATGPSALTRFELRAPIDGVITEKRISVGESVAGNAPVFTVSDLFSVWVEVPVPAKDLPLVQTGQAAQIGASAFDASAQGKVVFVSALLGEQTRTATARILLPNPKGLWRPGLPVKVRIMSDEADVPVAVRADAIQTVRDWQVVFGRYGQQFEARPLVLGRSDGHMVEVKEGLSAGEHYAASNSFVIKADLGKEGASHDH